MNKDLFIKETAAVITDKTLADITSGTKGTVLFDYFKIKDLWNEEHFQDLFMFHVHPGDNSWRSRIDHHVMNGWSMTFPINIWFSIITINYIRTYLCRQGSYLEIARIGKGDNLIISNYNIDRLSQFLLEMSYSKKKLTDPSVIKEIDFLKLFHYKPKKSMELV